MEADYNKLKKLRKLLQEDLSARVPYGVVVNHTNSNLKAYLTGIGWNGKIKLEAFDTDTTFLDTDVYAIKPYLRPLSDMTIEEAEVYNRLCYSINDFAENTDYISPIPDLTKWLDSHYFDHRGLIEKGVAIEVHVCDFPAYQEEQNKSCQSHAVSWTDDDQMMVDIIDKALEFLKETNEYVSDPITINDMRVWLRANLPSKYLEPLSKD